MPSTIRPHAGVIVVLTQRVPALEVGYDRGSNRPRSERLGLELAGLDRQHQDYLYDGVPGRRQLPPRPDLGRVCSEQSRVIL